ncbi:TRAP transporter small permease [Actinophytocola sp.]|uniref:TRAP transporter small permease n=1 Tax=Actinophytocola sp. TaxID=1872138 RepID=UPI003D6B4BAF
MNGYVHRPARMISTFLEGAAICCLVFLFAWVLAAVIARELLDYGLPHRLEVPAELMVAIAYLGLGSVTARNEHLAIDWIYRIVTGRAAQVLRSLIGLLCAATTGVWTYAAAQNTVTTYESEQGPAYGDPLPTWPAHIAFTVGLAAATIWLLIHVVDAIRGEQLTTGETRSGVISAASTLSDDAARPERKPE